MLLQRFLIASSISAALLSIFIVEASADPLREYKSNLVEIYRPLGFHPFFLPEGQQVGDVIDARTLAILHRSEECFPGLAGIQETDADLPKLHLLEDAAAGFWAGIKKLFNIELEAEETRRTYLAVEEVTIRSTSLGALRASLAPTCEEMLLPVFEENRMAKVGNRPADVVMSVMRGRLHTVLSYESGASAEARVEDVAALLKDLAGKLGEGVSAVAELSGELSARAELNERANVMLVSEAERTLAFRPATIFRPFLGGPQSDDIAVEPFDAEKSVHVERLGLRMEAWAEDPGE